MPMRYFIWWFQANGFSLEMLLYAWHANDATSGLVWDLTIAAVTLTIWTLYEVFAGHVKRRALWSIVATYCIGVSCGLPLYLFFRSAPKR
jgi:hypothetical protein